MALTSSAARAAGTWHCDRTSGWHVVCDAVQATSIAGTPGPVAIAAFTKVPETAKVRRSTSKLVASIVGPVAARVNRQNGFPR
jgi:hypothetical protein